MDRREAKDILDGYRLLLHEETDLRHAFDLAIEALKQTEIVRCKDCKHYNPPHIEYNDGTRKDYPDKLVTVDIGVNVGGKCENSTTTMRTYCLAHDREDPDDFEELVIYRQPMEYCSFGEKAEKHQLSGETSTISEKESVEGDVESATTTDCISRQDAIEAIDGVDWYHVNPKGELVQGSTSEEESWYKAEDIYKAIESLPPVTHEIRTETHGVCSDCISRQAAIEALTGWQTDPTDEEIMRTLKALPPVEPKRPKGEWVPCTEPPKDRRNVFLAHGTNDFKSCCIGHYDHSMGIWYEDKNFFAKPIYDCKYWCDIPDLPDMGDDQFDMRGENDE